MCRNCCLCLGLDGDDCSLDRYNARDTKPPLSPHPTTSLPTPNYHPKGDTNTTHCELHATTEPKLTQIWADVFAKALSGKDLKELLFNIGASGPAAAAGAPAAAAASDAPAAEEQEEEKDESDDDMGFGLFD